MGLFLVGHPIHAASHQETHDSTGVHAAKKKAPQSQEQEKNTTREIYSAMEPEPGPGSKTPQKQTLKQIDSFDPVPSAQREPITRRLRLIERLIREYGRAYDYRSVTIAELTAILTSLEKSGASLAREKSPETQGSEFDSGETPPPPPPRKIHLPELNTSRPVAPAEDSESGEPSPESSEGVDSPQAK